VTRADYVIDASVAVKMVIAEPGSAAARRLARRRLAAPDLLLPECANILWKAARRGELSPPQAQLACAALLALPLEIVPARALLPAALLRAMTLAHPAYDCLYLELAGTERLPLVTADLRLQRLSQPGVRVIGLDDLP
jgi:predicted nucleic acid-binding protein